MMNLDLCYFFEDTSSRRKFSITARQYYFLFINLLSFKVQKDYNVLLAMSDLVVVFIAIISSVLTSSNIMGNSVVCCIIRTNRDMRSVA